MKFYLDRIEMGIQSPRKNSNYIGLLFLLIWLLSFSESASASVTAGSLYNHFQNPPAKFLPVVYWFWNGEISQQGIREQLELIKHSGTVRGVVIMAWEGLRLDYLSEDWFQKVSYACSVAKQLGLKVWLYDEIRWPSGYAGGKVLEMKPELYARCLAREEHRRSGSDSLSLSIPPTTVAVVVAKIADQDRLDGSSLTDMTSHCQQDKFVWYAPEGNWSVNIFYQDSCQFQPTFLGEKYVDLLNPELARTFINITHEQYFQRMPEFFGNVIEAIITDEPGFYCNLKLFNLNPETIPYTPLLFSKYIEKNGYDLKPFLPALWCDIGEKTIAIRTDFYEFIAWLFQQSYLKPLQDWCGQHNIALNIQPAHEETMKHSTIMQGDYFKVMAYSDLYGGDEVYNWDKSAITPLLITSAAHAAGKRDAYCETFAAYGWDLSLEKMKAITDWLFVRGVNQLQLSAFYYAMNDGSWRMEVPPSLFIQNTLWQYLPKFTDYIRRLSLVLSSSQPITKIAIIRPNNTVRARLSLLDETLADEIDQRFIQLSNELFNRQVYFLYLDEETLIQQTALHSASDVPYLQLVDGDEQHRFELLILPDAEVLHESSYERIRQFFQNGGAVLAFGERLNYLKTDKGMVQQFYASGLAAEKKYYGDWIYNDVDSLAALIHQRIVPDVIVSPSSPQIHYIHTTGVNEDFFFVAKI